VIEERRAVDPLVRAREGRTEAVRIDRRAVECTAVELVGDRAQRGLGGGPVVEGALQRRPGIGSWSAGLAIASNDEKSSVSGAVAKSRELHLAAPYAARPNRSTPATDDNSSRFAMRTRCCHRRS